MLDKLKDIEKTALQSLNAIHDADALEAWRVANVGRSSPLMQVFSELGKLSKEERPAVGAAANRVKVALESALTERGEAIKAAALAKSLEEEQLDVTLPGRSSDVGGLHPVTRVMERIESFFTSVGSTVASGPEVEDDYHNFEALNIPLEHPARDPLDNFYLASAQAGCGAHTFLLRSQTSTVQIRVMETQPPPAKGSFLASTMRPSLACT